MKGSPSRCPVALGLALGLTLACAEDEAVESVRVVAPRLPESIDFGRVRVGARAVSSFEVESESELTLQVGFRVRGEDALAFSLVPGPVADAEQLPPGVSELELAYAPARVDGEEAAELVVSFPGMPSLSEQVVRLRGTPVLGRLTAEPSPLRLGVAVVGSTVTAELALTNEDLSVADVRLSLDDDPSLERFAGPEPRALRLAPGATGQVTVTLYARDPARPVALGELRAQAADGELTARVPLQGGVTAVPLRCPPRVDLGFLTAPGARTATVACENISRHPLRLTEATATSTAWSAALERDRVEPGERVGLELRFEGRPEAAPGRLETATFDLPVTVLDAPGARPEPARFDAVVRLGGPHLVVEPSRLDFERVSLGTSSALSIRVSNAGAWPLTLDRIALEGSDAFSVAALDRVEPNEARALAVTFTPSRTGVAEATLRLEAASPATGSPVEIALRGQGVNLPPCRDLQVIGADPLEFGAVRFDSPRRLPVRFENRGPGRCLVGPFASPVARPEVTAVDPAQIEVPPGESRDVDFQLVPDFEGVFSETVPVYANNRSGTVSLRFEGAGLTRRLLPNDLDGGVVRWVHGAYASPTEVRFDVSRSACAAQTKTVELQEQHFLRPALGSPFRVRSAYIGGLDRGAFHVGPTTRYVWPPGFGSPDVPAHWSFEVAYRPPTDGRHRASLFLEVEGLAKPITVPLDGRAAAVRRREQRVEGTSALDLLLLLGPSEPNPGTPDGQGRVRMVGGYGALRDRLDELWAAGVDLRVATLYTQAAGCPGRQPNVDTAFLPEPGPYFFDGECGYFAYGAGTPFANPSWRLVTAATTPSPREALERIWSPAFPGGRGAGSSFPLQHAFHATTWPLRRVIQPAFPRPGTPMAIVVVDDSSRVSLTEFEDYRLVLLHPDGLERAVPRLLSHFEALVGDRRSDLMVSLTVLADQREGNLLDAFRQPCASIDRSRLVEAMGPMTVRDFVDVRDYPTVFYKFAAGPTGGALALSRCPGWDSEIFETGLPLNGYRLRYPLDDIPVPGTLEVEVGGRQLPATSSAGIRHWRYDADFHRVDFEPGFAPRFREDVVFRYQPVCEAPE